MIGRDLLAVGFPAHAGMDPPPRPPATAAERLPRTRGDGPYFEEGVLVVATASPHTRGWTRSNDELHSHECGFPAHAGMDPSTSRTWRAGCRLPRTRGDGPSPLSTCVGRSTASPHTRGWTPGSAPPPAPPRGFPAHAGMDPVRCTVVTVTVRLPRTRGDGPVSQVLSNAFTGASPHTRGWTPVDLVVERHERGFPAHAGMDPSRRPGPAPTCGLPRTRGDGPQRIGECGG